MQIKYSFIISSENLSAFASIILAMFAISIILISKGHTNKVRIKKLREAGYTILEDGNRGNKMRKAGKIILGLFIAIIFIVIIFALFGWYMDLLATQQRLIDQGCTPLTFGSAGIATSWSCP